MESGSKLSLEGFEAIVTCPIHLGMLNDGRFLTCGHVFCLNCIDECLKNGLDNNNRESFICPSCRHPCNLSNGAESLPKACQLNQIVERITEKKTPQTDQIKSPPQQSDDADTTTTTPVFDLPASTIIFDREAVGSSNDNDSVFDPNFLNPYYTSAPIFATKDLSATSNTYSCNSIHSRLTYTTTENDFIDQENVKDSMRRNSKYQMKYKISTKVVPTNAFNSLSSIAGCAINQSANLPADITCADLFDNPNSSFDVIMVDRLRGNLMVRGNGEVTKQSIPIMVDSYKFHPIHLRLFDKYIFMSGRVDCEEPYYLIVKCTMEGHVISQSEKFLVSNTDIPPINGFFIDEVAREILVAMTASMKICTLNINLQDSGVCYSLEESNHPYYLLRKRDTKELWITCPKEGRILILDESTRAISQFGTQDIYHALPSVIVLTADNRIVFADCNENRIFWINKRNDYILVQTLKFQPSLHTSRVRSLTSLTDNRLLVVANDCVFISKPMREMSSSGSSSHKYCSIL